MALSLLVENLLQGAVSLLWIGGLARLTRPLPASLWMNLLAIGLLLPPALTVARALGLPDPGEPWALVRADRWADAVAGSPMALGLGGVLLAGTVLIFVVQELRPVLAARQRLQAASRRRDAALSAALDAVRARYHAAGVRMPRGRPLRAVLLETDRPIAALEGIASPVLVVSRGLLESLEPREVEAVLAHELAHHVQGGNRRLLVAWAVRVIQAASPPALVLFRTLIEAREVAADALAASVTRRPASLASALLKLHGRAEAPPADAGTLTRARRAVLRRAEIASVRLRVRTLLAPDARPTTAPWVTGLAVAALLGLLWGIR